MMLIEPKNLNTRSPRRDAVCIVRTKSISARADRLSYDVG